MVTEGLQPQVYVKQEGLAGSPLVAAAPGYHQLQPVKQELPSSGSPPVGGPTTWLPQMVKPEDSQEEDLAPHLGMTMDAAAAKEVGQEEAKQEKEKPLPPKAKSDKYTSLLVAKI